MSFRAGSVLFHIVRTILIVTIMAIRANSFFAFHSMGASDTSRCSTRLVGRTIILVGRSTGIWSSLIKMTPRFHYHNVSVIFFADSLWTVGGSSLTELGRSFGFFGSSVLRCRSSIKVLHYVCSQFRGRLFCATGELANAFDIFERQFVYIVGKMYMTFHRFEICDTNARCEHVVDSFHTSLGAALI